MFVNIINNEYTTHVTPIKPPFMIIKKQYDLQIRTLSDTFMFPVTIIVFDFPSLIPTEKKNV